MAEQSVIGVYADLAQAEEAVRRLDRGGFPIKQVSSSVKTPSMRGASRAM
jgi:hypothetical protein